MNRSLDRGEEEIRDETKCKEEINPETGGRRERKTYRRSHPARLLAGGQRSGGRRLRVRGLGGTGIAGSSASWAGPCPENVQIRVRPIIELFGDFNFPAYQKNVELDYSSI